MNVRVMDNTAVVRTQIQLTEAQARAVRRLAAERGVSMAQIVRQDDYAAEGFEP
ncbi:MAG: ribbon-helix-helix protein, CopG family [Armatimonadota bacterium]